MNYQQIRENQEIHALIQKADENLKAIGYTEHSVAHASLVAERAGEILQTLGYSPEEIELAKISGYMHDIGNTINRSRHAELGALLANDLLQKEGASIQQRLTILSAIGHHDESTGGATDVVSAALIIADKTDVRRSRVRQQPRASFDVHDRVNYAVEQAKLEILTEKKQIILHLEVDEEICTMYEYFEIFLGRMMMCRKAAELLGVSFKLMVNGGKVL